MILMNMFDVWSARLGPCQPVLVKVLCAAPRLTNYAPKSQTNLPAGPCLRQ